MRSWLSRRISRRRILAAGMVAGGGSIIARLASGRHATAQGVHAEHGRGSLLVGSHPAHGNMITVGEVNRARNGFDPTDAGAHREEI
jgi:manganese oxidase